MDNVCNFFLAEKRISYEHLNEEFALASKSFIALEVSQFLLTRSQNVHCPRFRMEQGGPSLLLFIRSNCVDKAGWKDAELFVLHQTRTQITYMLIRIKPQFETTVYPTSHQLRPRLKHVSN